MKRCVLLPVLCVAVLLGGCSTFKKLTGQRNDTVLPGQREEILSPDQYTAKNQELERKPEGEPTDMPAGEAPPATTSTGTQPKSGQVCNPEVDPDCVPPAKPGNKGIFDDG